MPEFTEKERRVYYQGIVYDVCCAVDVMLGKSVRAGTATVCGTVGTPSIGVQNGLKELVAELDEARIGAERWSELAQQAGREGKQALIEGLQAKRDLETARSTSEGRDLQVTTATRLQLINAVKEWQESGKSVEQLLFRMKTTHIKLPDTMIVARCDNEEGSDDEGAD